MKQFNLAEYLQLKNEGNDPRIVTRDGRSVRIICTDQKNDTGLCVAGLTTEYDGQELLRSFYPDGNYAWSNSNLDIFFADLNEEPKYRPYKDAEEAYQEAVKHNSWCIDETGRYRHVDIITDKALDCLNFHDVFVFGWTWADDGSPCGVKED